MSQGGHAGHMTQLIVERMAALDGPATVDEITDAVANGSSVPWNYVFQRYQQYLCQNNQGRRDVTTNGSMVTSDPQLGWRAPGFNPNDPTHRRKALRFVVNKRLELHSVSAKSGRRRAWSVRDAEGRYRLNPDESQMPKIRTINGHSATFTTAARAEIADGKAAQIAVITRNSDRRIFDQLRPAEQATLLRWLAEQLDYDRGAATRVRPVLTDWKRRNLDHQGALGKMRDLLCRDATI